MTNEHSPLIGRIVCSLASDTDVSSELKWAIAVAGHFDATLDVLQIHDAADGVRELKYIAFEDHSRHLMRCLDSYQRFDQLVQAAGASIRVATYRAEGPAVAAILQHAKQSRSDLVILSSAQVVATLGQLPADIGRAVGELVGCALLTVQRGEPPPAFRRILLPVDFSAATSAATRWSVAFSKRFGSSIELLHVVPASSPVAATENAAATGHVADAGLKKLESELREQGICVASTSIAHADTARAIVEQYTSGSFDLIVMGLSAATYPRTRTGTIARIRQNHDVSLLSVGAITPHADFVRNSTAQTEEELRASRVDATG